MVNNSFSSHFFFLSCVKLCSNELADLLILPDEPHFYCLQHTGGGTLFLGFFKPLCSYHHYQDEKRTKKKIYVNNINLYPLLLYYL